MLDCRPNPFVANVGKKLMSAERDAIVVREIVKMGIGLAGILVDGDILSLNQILQSI